jgi:hypothetical protein
MDHAVKNGLSSHFASASLTFATDRQPICHRLNMELDLQSLFRLHVYTAVLIGRNPATPPSPRIWAHKRGRYRYWLAKIDDISL